MKADLKNTSEKGKIAKGGGGARKGSGRRKILVETKLFPVRIPLELLSAIENHGVKNKTAYILNLIKRDLDLDR